MTKLKIGILDIIALPAQNLGHKVFTSIFAKQLVSFMPQAISVWCRQAGHDVFYATYYGAGHLESVLPDDPDIVFISCPTSLSHLAYMLAKQYGRTKTLTVIGGPHAVAFPADCLRFFDVVVKECDRQLVTDILAGEIPPHSFISSSRPIGEFPCVRERLPEIRRATFYPLTHRYPAGRPGIRFQQGALGCDGAAPARAGLFHHKGGSCRHQ